MLITRLKSEETITSLCSGKVFIINCHGSLTAAQDGRSVLQNAGVFSQLARAPKQIAEQGCGYVLEVDGPDGADALTLFLSSGVRFRRVFRQFDNGFVEEAGHDLF